MRVEMNLVPEATLQDFAERQDLVLEVNERDPELAREVGATYYVGFKDVQIKDGVFRRSTSGNGNTIHEAASDLARQLSRQTIVINAFDMAAPREVRAPILRYMMPRRV